MIKGFRILFIVSALLACNQSPQDIYLGQGIMAGEVTSTSVILQSRLTTADTLSHGDLIGSKGVGMFQIDLDSTFNNPINSRVMEALPENDFIVKTKIQGLDTGSSYFYRLKFGKDTDTQFTSETGSFKTLPGPDTDAKVAIVVVTGMNYYHFHFGQYDRTKAYAKSDKRLGYPALKTIRTLSPDYFIGTGDNVYFDHPNQSNFDKAIEAGKNPHPGGYGGMEVVDEIGMRRKYHEQFAQPRFKDLFRSVSTYWQKDDHDYRFNDADTIQDFPISHELGIRNFKEQLPIVYPGKLTAKTYRTHRMNKDLQIWLLEGRDYRSPNKMEDGPHKTLLGTEQLSWLKKTLSSSDATFKFIISPTPMVGPDDAYKRDNHVNHLGFRHEGESFFEWLVDQDFLDKNLYIICGDRHWQYHAKHPSGVEEFCTGALVDNNARAGRLAGDPNSTDPEGLIEQFYIQGDKESASGGFLLVSVNRLGDVPIASFRFYDEQGTLLYETQKEARSK